MPARSSDAPRRAPTTLMLFDVSQMCAARAGGRAARAVAIQSVHRPRRRATTVPLWRPGRARVSSPVLLISAHLCVRPGILLRRVYETRVQASSHPYSYTLMPKIYVLHSH